MRRQYEELKKSRKNFCITRYINYPFDLINYVSLLLSSKTIANSPEYCIYTSVVNTYCVNERGFYYYFFNSLSLLSPFLSPVTLSSALAVSFFPWPSVRFEATLALVFLSVYHTTRARWFVEIYRIKERYLLACSSSNIHNNTTETWSHVYYSGFCL